MKKLAILGTNGLPPKYGGFETLVDNLTKIESPNLAFIVFCSKTKKENRYKKYNNASLKYINLKANGFQSIVYDVISLLVSWFKYDYILLLGTPGSPIIPVLKLFRNKTIIATNFGGLEWKRNKWNILIRSYLKYSEKIAIKYSDIVVADNQHFVNYIRKTYDKEPLLIEYGGNHAKKIEYSIKTINKYPFINSNYGISISRAQPDNLLHVVLDAYITNKDKKIVLISNWESFQYGRELKRKYSGIENIIILDAIYDLNELNLLRSNAAYYIHSHTFCGTAPSLVEAMNLGLPVISFDTETNRFTTEGNAIYFRTVEDLALILKSVNEETLSEVGLKMEEIAKRRYLWDTIREKYINIFSA